VSANRRLVLVAVLAVALLGTAAPFGTAWWLTRSWHGPPPTPPAALRCADVDIPWRHGLVSGWLVEGDDALGSVLLLHGWRRDRTVMLGRAQMLASAGYSVLLIDLPAHGQSSGTTVTFGRDEGAALDAVLAFLRERFPDRPLGVIGQSLGGAQLLAARREVALDAVVLESTFPTLQQAFQARMRRYLGPLGPPTAPLLQAAVMSLRGLSAAEVRPVDRVGQLGCPLLFLHGARDRSTPLPEARQFFAAAQEPKQMWVIEGAAHGDLRAAAGSEYDRRVLEFFGQHLRPAATRART
jgi:pimeloyl-ACP methyl ester carboxylesterase